MLNGKVPKLIGILPDAFQGHDRMGTGLVTGSEEGTAALSHMLSRLLACANPETPVSLMCFCFGNFLLPPMGEEKNNKRNDRC